MRVHRPLGLLVLALALVPLLPGCEPLTCPTASNFAVSVAVEHTDTGEPIEGALAVVREGSFADSARTGSTGTASLAFDRAGTYAVSVEKDGFQTRTLPDVPVDLNECHHPDRAYLEVELMPQ